MGKAAKILFFSALLFLSARLPLYAQSDTGFRQEPAAIQISSNITDGKLSVSDILKIAKENNIKIVILTDRDYMKWEYGLWPWPNLIKKTVENSSVFKYGIDRYFKLIDEAQKENSDIVLIAGAECAPFYYWTGNPFTRNLKMYNWHKHILVIGLDKTSDYQNMPCVANKNALALPFIFKDIYRLWPILILFIGILCFNKRKFQYKDYSGRSLGPYALGWRILATCLIILGILSLLNNFPLHRFKYDQYHGDEKIAPYQDLINYVNQKGGATFWAHPEAENIEKLGSIVTETREYADNLLRNKDYTGFAIFYEGYEKVGRPGGIWDEVLRQYCQGRREKPVWVIGGLAFDQNSALDAAIKDLRTVFIIPELNKNEVLNALKQGRMYVVRGKNSSKLILDKFSLKDASSGKEKIMGQEIVVQGKMQIQINGHFLNGENLPLEVKLIKNGEIIKTFEVISPFGVSYEGESEEKGKKTYYRLEIGGSDTALITNPIFVNPVTDKTP